MNSNRVTLLVLLDLSAAFDTVDHAILLKRLTTDFGIGGKALEWFLPYLSGRSGQRVLFEGATSDSFDLRFGVPQGSCLGPLLFVVYASKLFEIVQDHLPNAQFADDTQLYLSFDPNGPTDQAMALEAVERCISDLRKWMYRNKLKMIRLNVLLLDRDNSC